MDHLDSALPQMSFEFTYPGESLLPDVAATPEIQWGPQTVRPDPATLPDIRSSFTVEFDAGNAVLPSDVRKILARNEAPILKSWESLQDPGLPGKFPPVEALDSDEPKAQVGIEIPVSIVKECAELFGTERVSIADLAVDIRNLMEIKFGGASAAGFGVNDELRSQISTVAETLPNQTQGGIIPRDLPWAEIIENAKYSTRKISFQDTCLKWAQDVLGEASVNDKTERALRFLEEALELVQVAGVSAEQVATMTDYVFGRPQGEIHQEVGGVGLTLALLCGAHDVDMDRAFKIELTRVSDPEIKAKVRAEQEAKPDDI